MEKEIIKRLKEYMAENDISQTQLAQKLGWTSSDLSTTLSGNKPIGGRRLAHIANTLGISFEIKGDKYLNNKTSAPPLTTYTKEEQTYIDKLIGILRGLNEDNTVAIKSNLNAFYKSRNMKEDDEVINTHRPLRKKAANDK